jgi:rubredoxin
MKPGHLETCEKCGMHFETQRAIVDSGIAPGFIRWPDIPPRVQCPRCGNVFRSTRYRFFGFVPPEVFRILFYTFVSIFAVGALLFVVFG